MIARQACYASPMDCREGEQLWDEYNGCMVQLGERVDALGQWNTFINFCGSDRGSLRGSSELQKSPRLMEASYSGARVYSRGPAGSERFLLIRASLHFCKNSSVIHALRSERAESMCGSQTRGPSGSNSRPCRTKAAVSRRMPLRFGLSPSPGSEPLGVQLIA